MDFSGAAAAVAAVANACDECGAFVELLLLPLPLLRPRRFSFPRSFAFTKFFLLDADCNFPLLPSAAAAAAAAAAEALNVGKVVEDGGWGEPCDGS